MANSRYLKHMAEHLGVTVPENLGTTNIPLLMADGTSFSLPSPPTAWADDATLEEDADDTVAGQKATRYLTFRDDPVSGAALRSVDSVARIAHLARFVTEEYAPAKAAERFRCGDPERYMQNAGASVRRIAKQIVTLQEQGAKLTQREAELYAPPELKSTDLAAQMRDIELRNEFRTATAAGRRSRLLQDIIGYRRPEMYRALLRDPELLANDRNFRLNGLFKGMWQ